MLEQQTDPLRQQPSSPAPIVTATVDQLLATTGLIKESRHRRVVNGVSIRVAAGEIVGLLGPNGAGKTTTFNMVVGVVRPDSGEVLFNRTNITKFAMHKRARLG